MSFVVETLAIGDELLAGKTADTNTTFVAEQLLSRGIAVLRATVVRDDEEVIHRAIRECAVRADFLICFGGLGPTSDDKTVDAVARLLGCPIVEHARSRERLQQYYSQRGRVVDAVALRQVRYPQQAEAIENPLGLAPAFTLSVGKCQVLFLPGVPWEMKAIFLASGLPRVEAASGNSTSQPLFTRSWRLLGIWESQLQGLLDPVEAALPVGAWLGYRTCFPENHLTLYFRGTPDVFQQQCHVLRHLLAPWCYSEENKSLEEVVLGELEHQKLRLVVAESCTGGLVAQRLTRVAGASIHFWGGYTTYSVDAKRRMLAIELESDRDAVSANCTRDLANAAKRESGCEIAAAITGYLGPGGGSEEDPVGTIYLCVVGQRRFEKRMMLSIKDRELNQWGASAYLLDAIRQVLRGE